MNLIEIDTTAVALDAAQVRTREGVKRIVSTPELATHSFGRLAMPDW